jgi:hypothetical protein
MKLNLKSNQKLIFLSTALLVVMLACITVSGCITIQQESSNDNAILQPEVSYPLQPYYETESYSDDDIFMSVDFINNNTLRLVMLDTDDSNYTTFWTYSRTSNLLNCNIYQYYINGESYVIETPLLITMDVISDTIVNLWIDGYCIPLHSDF